MLTLLSCQLACLALALASSQPPTNGHSMAGAGAGLVVNTTAGLLQGKRLLLFGICGY